MVCCLQIQHSLFCMSFIYFFDAYRDEINDEHLSVGSTVVFSNCPRHKKKTRYVCIKEGLFHAYYTLHSSPEHCGVHFIYGHMNKQ